MGGKIPIRRNGSLIPILSLGLVGVLLFIIGWLCTVGLPDFALRAIEREAGKYGVQLHVDNMRMDISSHFALMAQDVTAEVPQGDLPPLHLSVKKITLHPDFLRLSLHKAVFFNAEGSLPLGEGEDMTPSFRLKFTELRLPSGGSELHFSTSGTIFHSDTFLSVDLPLPLVPGDDAETPPINPSAWLAEHRPMLRDLWQQVADQGFGAGNTPKLKLALDLRRAEEPRGYLNAQIPRLFFDEGEIYDIDLVAYIRQNIFEIGRASVSVVRHDTPEQEKEKKSLTLNLSGHFDLQDGDTSLRLRLRGIPQALAEITPMTVDETILHQYGIKADTPFMLDLNGACTLTPPEAEAPSTPGSAKKLLPIEALLKRLEPYTRLTQESVGDLKLEGDISQGPFTLRHRHIKGFTSSFYVGDGYYNLSHVRVLLPQGGELSGSYTIGKDKGSARLNVSSSLDELQQLAYALTGEEAELPPDMSVDGDIKLDLRADLSAGRFYPGKSDPARLIPTLHALSVQVSAGDISRFLSYDIQAPELFLSLADLQYTADSHLFNIGRAELHTRAERVRLADESAARAPLLPTWLSVLTGEDLSAQVVATQLQYTGNDLTADSLSTEVSLRQGAAQLHHEGTADAQDETAAVENLVARLDTKTLSFGHAEGDFLSHLSETTFSAAEPDLELGWERFDVTQPGGAEQAMLPPGALEKCRLHFSADKAGYAPTKRENDWVRAVGIDNATCSVTGDALSLGHARMKGLELRLSNVDFSAEMPTLLPLNTELLAKIDSYTVQTGDEAHGVEGIELSLTPDRSGERAHPCFAAELNLGKGEDGKNLRLLLENRALSEQEAKALFPARTQREYICIPGGQRLQIPWNELCRTLKEIRTPSGEPLLTSEDLLEGRFQLPDDFSITTKDSYLLLGQEPQLLCLGWNLDIPRLVSIPSQPVLHDSPVTFGLHLSTRLTQNLSGGYTYTGQAELTEGDNSLTADYRGDTAAGSIRVTNGTCTITADKIDRLIDDPDAHNIIRDFRFIPGTSSLSATNIEVNIDYKDALKVLVNCDADVLNTDYQMMSFEDTLGADGVTVTAEKRRADLEAEPYARVAEARCKVTVDLQYYDEPGKDVQLVTLGQPMLRYDNTPWIQARGLEPTQTNKESTVTGDSVVFDLERDALFLNNLQGTCFPAYSFGMFYPDLHTFLQDIILLSPVDVRTAQCVFPLTMTTPTAMSGTIEVCMQPNQSGFYRLAGIEIPLRHFSGMVTLTDKAVYLRELNSLTWGGVLNGQMSIGWTDSASSFDGELTAQNMLLSRIARSASAKLPEGLCRGYIRFRAPSADLDSLQAYGRVNIEDSDLRQLSLFSTVDAVLDDINSGSLGVEKSVRAFLSSKSADSSKHLEHKDSDKPRSTIFSRSISRLYDGEGVIDVKNWPLINRTLKYDLQDADMPFTIEGGKLNLTGGRASGLNLTVNLDAAISLHNMALSGSLRPKFYHIGFPFGVHLGGTLSDVRYSIWGSIAEDAEQELINIKQDFGEVRPSANKDVETVPPASAPLNHKSGGTFSLWR